MVCLWIGTIWSNNLNMSNNSSTNSNKMNNFIRKSLLKRNNCCRITYNKLRLLKVLVEPQTCVAPNQVLIVVIKYHNNNM